MDPFMPHGMGQDDGNIESTFWPGDANSSGIDSATLPQYNEPYWGGDVGPSSTNPGVDPQHYSTGLAPSGMQRCGRCRWCGHNPDLDDEIWEAIMVACAICIASRRQTRHNQRFFMFPIRLSGADYIEGLLNHPSTTNFENNYRMVSWVFRLLAQRIVAEGGYILTERTTVEEALAMFMKITGHENVHRDVCDRFQHSAETVNSCFHKILDTLCRMAPHIDGNSKYDPWFRDCIGTMDGTHIVSAGVYKKIKAAYYDRHKQVTQNVLCICDFDMLYTFVYSGWEGSAHDTRILFDAMRAPGFPHPPPGKYYVVDSGYPCLEGYLSPYKGERYHLQNYNTDSGARGPRELFNHNHSSLRNIIERSFSALKSRFAMLTKIKKFELRSQAKMVLGCCVIHNFIKLDRAEDDDIFQRWGNPNIVGETNETDARGHPLSGSDPEFGNESAVAMRARRDEITGTMWMYE